MEVRPTALEGVVEIQPARHGDDRGWFVEAWNAKRYAEAGLELDWAQDNESFSAPAGTLRGIHYQLPPFSQAKLVRVLQGRALDVAVDLRRSSPTFGEHVAVELDAALGNQLFVPTGFGHAFCTLEPDCLFVYKASNFYSAEHDRSIRWNDPTLGIEWPFPDDELTLADKDRAAPLLADAEIFD